MERLKILVSAYACSPYHGSEPGMGWNFISGLSDYHELHIITEKRKWEEPINQYLEQNPSLRQNMKFYFIDKKRNKWLRRIWPPSYYWFYRQWQKKAYALAQQLDIKVNFNIIHQLNMVGYREPGYLWKINKPFVWGPIGGLDNSPWRFLPSLGLKGMIYYGSRNLINLWQRNLNLRPKKAGMCRNSAVIAATPGTAALVESLWSRKAFVICEVGQSETVSSLINARAVSEPLKIIWSGQHTPGKNLTLLLKSICNISISFELHILGKGEMTEIWKKEAKSLMVDKFCKWYGWVERSRAIEILKNGHVFCITSIKDLTATVTLEALSHGLPIICLDHCGFAHVVTSDCGIKIPVDTPANATENFKTALIKLYEDEEYRQRLQKGALKRAVDFSWPKKIEKLNNIYSRLLKQKD